MKKEFLPHFTSSQSLHAKEAFKLLTSCYPQTALNKASHIIALGGDGHMLKMLHKYKETSLPIFGMNRGSFGFLMNKYNPKNLDKRVKEANSIQLSALKLQAIDTHRNIKEGSAFNEVSILRSKGQAAKLAITVDGIKRIKQLTCDGILVATAAGSTAYNRACNGPILPLDSQVFALTPISPFRPRWNGAILPDTTIIEIENLYPVERPTNAAADFLEFRHIQYLRIQKSMQMSPTLLFDPDFHLKERIIGEQFTL